MKDNVNYVFFCFDSSLVQIHVHAHDVVYNHSFFMNF